MIDLLYVCNIIKRTTKDTEMSHVPAGRRSVSIDIVSYSDHYVLHTINRGNMSIRKSKTGRTPGPGDPLAPDGPKPPSSPGLPGSPGVPAAPTNPYRNKTRNVMMLG